MRVQFLPGVQRPYLNPVRFQSSTAVATFEPTFIDSVRGHGKWQGHTILIPKMEIDRKVAALAHHLWETYHKNPNVSAQKPLMVLTLLNGSLPFYSRLTQVWDRLNAKYPNKPLFYDFIGVETSSYGSDNSTGSGKPVRISSEKLAKWEEAMRSGRREHNPDILVVDDIYDTGRTIKALKDRLSETVSTDLIKVTTLLDKRDTGRIYPFTDLVDYFAFSIPNFWVYGCGLDSGGQHRGIPHLCVNLN